MAPELVEGCPPSPTRATTGGCPYDAEAKQAGETPAFPGWEHIDRTMWKC